MTRSDKIARELRDCLHVMDVPFRWDPLTQWIDLQGAFDGVRLLYDDAGYTLAIDTSSGWHNERGTGHLRDELRDISAQANADIPLGTEVEED